MPNQHKTPMLGWHPPAELSAWARAEAKRRDVPLKVILDEALADYRAHRKTEDGDVLWSVTAIKRKKESTVTEDNEDAEPEDGEELWARYGDNAEERREEL